MARKKHLAAPANYPPFYLTVNSDGLVSLWDEKEQTENVPGEILVVLELTLEQIQTLDTAKELARAL